MTSDKIKISGIAVREGVSRNNRKYIAKELKSFAPTLVNRPILKDHEGVTDNVIGKVTTSEFKEDGNMVVYEGWIKEDGTKLLDKVRDGRISEVSIGAMAGRVVKENEDDDIIIPTQMEALELSTTPVPGNKGTSLFLQTTENIDLSEEGITKMIENYDKENNSNSHSNSNSISNNGDIRKTQTERRLKMESEEKEKALQLQVETLVKEKAELEKLNTEKVEVLEKEKVELEIARKQDAINRYTEKAKAKNITAKDLSNSSMETITMAIEMVDELPEPTNSDEDNKDEDKDDNKDTAEPKTKDVDNQSAKPNVFEGYVVDSEDVIKGQAFYKYY